MNISLTSKKFPILNLWHDDLCSVRCYYYGSKLVVGDNEGCICLQSFTVISVMTSLGKQPTCEALIAFVRYLRKVHTVRISFLSACLFHQKCSMSWQITHKTNQFSSHFHLMYAELMTSPPILFSIVNKEEANITVLTVRLVVV